MALDYGIGDVQRGFQDVVTFSVLYDLAARFVITRYKKERHCDPDRINVVLFPEPAFALCMLLSVVFTAKRDRPVIVRLDTHSKAVSIEIDHGVATTHLPLAMVCNPPPRATERETGQIVRKRPLRLCDHWRNVRGQKRSWSPARSEFVVQRAKTRPSSVTLEEHPLTVSETHQEFRMF